jgi:hypothetical protein
MSSSVPEATLTVNACTVKRRLPLSSSRCSAKPEGVTPPIAAPVKLALVRMSLAASLASTIVSFIKNGAIAHAKASINTAPIFKKLRLFAVLFIFLFPS